MSSRQSAATPSAMIAIGVVLVAIIAVLAALLIFRGPGATTAATSPPVPPQVMQSEAVETDLDTASADPTPTDPADESPNTIASPAHVPVDSPVPRDYRAAPAPVVAPPITETDAASGSDAAPEPVAPEPTLEPTCLADAGITLSIIGVEKVDESTVFDIYDVTVEIDNRFEIPVEVGYDVLMLAETRGAGVSMGPHPAGIDRESEIPAGRSTYVAHDVNFFRNFGSPVISLDVSANLDVRNGVDDRNDRHMYCQFADVKMGQPYAGSWGS